MIPVQRSLHMWVELTLCFSSSRGGKIQHQRRIIILIIYLIHPSHDEVAGSVLPTAVVGINPHTELCPLFCLSRAARWCRVSAHDERGILGLAFVNKG
jgi:hypothetical protein